MRQWGRPRSSPAPKGSVARVIASSRPLPRHPKLEALVPSSQARSAYGIFRDFQLMPEQPVGKKGTESMSNLPEYGTWHLPTFNVEGVKLTSAWYLDWRAQRAVARVSGANFDKCMAHALLVA